MFKDFVYKKFKISASEVLKVWHDPEFSGDFDWLIRFWKNEFSCYELIQQSKQATVLKGTIPSVSQTVFLKKLHVRKKVDVLKNMVRQTRARRAVLMGESAEAKGFKVCRPLFLMESFKFGLHYESGLITEEVDNAPSVAGWVVYLKDKPEEAARFVEAFGQLIGHWHKRGCYHGDLRTGNVLAKLIDDQWEFYFLDNERNLSLETVSKARIIHNLMQVNMTLGVSRRLRFLFWNAYNEVMRFSEADARQIIRKVHNIVKSRLTAKNLFDRY